MTFLASAVLFLHALPAQTDAQTIKRNYVTRWVEVILASGAPRGTVIVEMKDKGSTIEFSCRDKPTGQTKALVLSLHFSEEKKPEVKAQSGWSLLGPVDSSGRADLFRIAARDSRLAGIFDHSFSASAHLNKSGGNVILSSGNKSSDLCIVSVKNGRVTGYETGY